MSLDISEELEGTFKVPKAFLAFLAIIVGVLVLFFPYILNIMIAFFLIVWGLLKAVELGTKPSKDASVRTGVTPANIVQATESESE